MLWVGLLVDAGQCSGQALKVTLAMSQGSRDHLAAGMRQMSCHGNGWSKIATALAVAPVPSHLDHRSPHSACCWLSHSACCWPVPH